MLVHDVARARARAGRELLYKKEREKRYILTGSLYNLKGTRAEKKNKSISFKTNLIADACERQAIGHSRHQPFSARSFTSSLVKSLGFPENLVIKSKDRCGFKVHSPLRALCGIALSFVAPLELSTEKCKGMEAFLSFV